MLPRIKWGLIAGGVVALLNLCGGSLIGAFNNCLSLVTVPIAAILAGYFCARQEPPEEAIKAGGVAGGIVGVINIISQTIGGMIGGLVGAGFLASYTNQAQADPTTFTQGVGLGLGVIVAAAMITGALLTLVSVGLGALTAKLTMPKAEVISEG